MKEPSVLSAVYTASSYPIRPFGRGVALCAHAPFFPFPVRRFNLLFVVVVPFRKEKGMKRLSFFVVERFHLIRRRRRRRKCTASFIRVVWRIYCTTPFSQTSFQRQRLVLLRSLTRASAKDSRTLQ